MESQTIRKGAGVLPGAMDVSRPIMKEPECQSGLISKASAHNPVLVVAVPAGRMLS